MLNIINKGSIQNKFIDYLNGKDYVFKYKHYSFLIFSCKKIQKELEQPVQEPKKPIQQTQKPEISRCMGSSNHI